MIDFDLLREVAKQYDVEVTIAKDGEGGIYVGDEKVEIDLADDFAKLFGVELPQKSASEGL